MRFQVMFGLLVSVFSASAAAERPTYNFIQVGATELEQEQVTGDYTGGEIIGSYELPDNFYIHGRIMDTEADDGVEVNFRSVGIGYHEALFGDTVIVVQLDAVEVTFGQREAGDFIDTAHQVSVGIESQLTDRLKVSLTGRSLDAGLVDEEFGYYRPNFFIAGASFEIAKGFGVYFDYEKEENSQRSVVGFRYNY